MYPAGIIIGAHSIILAGEFLIENRDVERIVVNYKDRLMRFGYEVLE
nr:hypothetical protein [Natranaerobius trueperi]